MPGVEDYKAILFLVLIWHSASCPQELFQTRRYSCVLLEFDTEVLSHITENRQTDSSHMLVAYTTKGGVRFGETWKSRRHRYVLSASFRLFPRTHAVQ